MYQVKPGDIVKRIICNNGSAMQKGEYDVVIAAPKDAPCGYVYTSKYAIGNSPDYIEKIGETSVYDNKSTTVRELSKVLNALATTLDSLK
jgi:hypothetical protein